MHLGGRSRIADSQSCSAYMVSARSAMDREREREYLEIEYMYVIYTYI